MSDHPTTASTTRAPAHQGWSGSGYQPSAQRQTKTDSRLVVDHYGQRGALMSLSQLIMSQTTAERSSQDYRPVQLCDHPSTCTKDKCHFVHTKDSIDCILKPVHCNLRYSDLSQIPYDRVQGEGRALVSFPNKGGFDLAVNLNQLLLTKGVCHIKDGDAVVHCRHFLFGRACTLARQCDYAHVVTSVRVNFACEPGRLVFAEKVIVPSNSAEKPRRVAKVRKSVKGNDWDEVDEALKTGEKFPAQRCDWTFGEGAKTPSRNNSGEVGVFVRPALSRDSSTGETGVLPRPGMTPNTSGELPVMPRPPLSRNASNNDTPLIILAKPPLERNVSGETTTTFSLSYAASASDGVQW